MYSSTVIFQPLSAVLSFSAGVNYCIPALLISSPTQLFSVYQQDLLLYSSTVNFQLHTAVLRLLARNKYSFPVLTCIFSCILFFPHFLINDVNAWLLNLRDICVTVGLCAIWFLQIVFLSRFHYSLFMFGIHPKLIYKVWFQATGV